MRILFVFLFIVIGVDLSAQQENVVGSASNDLSIPYGYIGPTRLDSLPGNFGEFELIKSPATPFLSMIFRYYESRYDRYVSDNSGNDIVFTNLASALSFLDRNGWVYADNIQFNGQTVFLTKRRAAFTR